MRVVVDNQRCVGSGMCVLTQPDVFDQSEDDGTVVLLRAEPAPEQERDVLEAVHTCPAQAISTS
ncbi:ferredoxin [Actinokineospora globicatena]|uniref:Ferredoxin n=1 Tax=Actinokineospora globicatena TaxID=103729 RepID=A0A9W6QJR1_9PSEU|nr:ferredoxin [Actinokineospora globicatena]MCP2306486.1 Ferredoxin [Actinokineospora globicatena]GLW81915.1 ferredoxin [Actinokineospora globicatena]GLW88709.1 ferredoxin [Actinokineospora globicatena]GLW89413.1 ferredoxin [Actinokineospora globicatena]